MIFLKIATIFKKNKVITQTESSIPIWMMRNNIKTLLKELNLVSDIYSSYSLMLALSPLVKAELDKSSSLF